MNTLRHIPRRLFLAALLAVVSMSAASSAEEKYVRVELNKGAMIRLEAPVNSVAVADPNTADVQIISPRLIFVHGKKIGDTSVYAINANDETVYSATIEVTHNLSKLSRMIRRVAPDANISLNTVNGGLVMEGTSNSPVESENIRSVASAFLGADDKMVNMVRTAGSDQVMLQVKVVEMARNDAKRFGINFSAVLNPKALGLQILQGEDIISAAGALDRGGSTNSAIFGEWTGANGRSISSFLDMLESQGLVQVLAEPSLTTTSGKAASFLAGGEFPIPVRGSDGSVSIQYKPFGVSLNFTPIVMAKDRMSVTVAPEVSTISFDNPIEVDGIRNPILLTRKASATVELGSGETFALAGLLRNDKTNSIEKFPGLGDVPVLGTLFRSQNFQNNQTELVILVTPYVVRAVADGKLQTPEEGYVPPTDLQRVMLGNLYQQEPMAEEKEEKTDEPKLQGSGGFILE